MQKLSIGLLVLSTLAACGGSGSTPPATEDPVPQNPDLGQDELPLDSPIDEAPEASPLPVARLFSGAAEDFAPTAGGGESSQITLTVDGDKVILNNLGGEATAGYEIGFGEKDDVSYVAGIAGSTDAEVGFVSGLNGNSDDPMIGYFYVERQGETVMPVSGTAQFNGDYLGTLGPLFVQGDAVIKADFASETLSGGITNREFFADGFDVPYAQMSTTDMVLELGQIDDQGRFGGTVSGGHLVEGDDQLAPVNGYYEGLITGSDGDSVAGGIRSEFNLFGQTSYEVGTFIAE